MASLNQKVAISAYSAPLFAVINLPFTYKFTNGLLGGLIGPLYANGCPTMLGLLLHTAVFYIITLWSMKGAPASQSTKVKHSLTGTLIFLLLSIPFTYKLVGKYLNGVVNSRGCQTQFGVFVHSLVYMAVLVLLMLK